MSTHMSLWRTDKNYPLIITKFSPYLFFWKTPRSHLLWTQSKAFSNINNKDTNIWWTKTKTRQQRTPFEPRHDKTNKVSVCPAKTQISLGLHPGWSASSLSTWRKLGSLATHWAHSEDSDQTELMPRLIWVFAGRTLILLVLSCRGSCTCSSAFADGYA